MRTSKQVSFFDQKKPLNKPPWPSRKNCPNNSTLAPEAKPARPPIVASTTSRKKLQAFQFIEEREESDESMGGTDGDAADKENIGSQPGHTNASQQSDRLHADGPQKLSQVSHSNASQQSDRLHPGGIQKLSQDGLRQFPMTPVGRVPLADLIGNCEDPLDRSPIRSPVERVVWNHSAQSSAEPCSYMTPVTKRGKKRARSSSPPSSNKVGAIEKPAFDLQNLQASLGSPQADPALDLENRYFAKNKWVTPSRPSASAAADFMHSSSPERPEFTSSDSGKLRRTVSCGLEWPAATKRRRISRNSSQFVHKDVTTDTPRQKPRGDTTALNALLDQIQCDLPGKIADAPERSQSCPLRLSELPDTINPSSSQKVLGQDLRDANKIGEGSEPEEQQHAGASHHSQEKRSQGKTTVSSNYDDDELDIALFESIGTVVQQEPEAAPTDQADVLESRRLSNGNCSIDKLFNETTNLQRATTAVSDKVTESAAVQNFAQEGGENLNDHDNDDDDDDFDDQMFAADMEDVAKLYDEQPTPLAPEGQFAREISHIHSKSPPKPVSPIPPIQEISPRSEKQTFTTCIEVSSDEEFGEGIDFDEIAEEYDRAAQAGDLVSKDERPLPTQRFLIVSIAEGEYQDRGFSRPEKVLLVQDETTKAQKAATLQQSWFDSPCTIGAVVHVLGHFDRGGQCTINDAQNFLILHPDHLISATVVGDSFGCTRRAILQDRIKATNEASPPQVYGHILHEIFQEALKANRWDTEWLSKTIKTIGSRYLESFYEIHVDINAAVDHLMSKVPELQGWAKLFVSARPKPNASVRDRKGASALMSVNKLLDVEEHIWSPRYGLKGNIDATVQVTMRDAQGERNLTVPFEVKTGRNTSNTSHNAQTTLYTLLLSDRYDIQIAYGILYYMETSDISRIPGMRHEILHMIKQRNKLACYVHDRRELPPMLKDPRLCGRCYAQKPCFIYHKLVEGGDGNSSGMKEQFNELVKHLTPIHQEFFKNWDDLLTKEETDVIRFRRELWTMTSSERERVGRCFGNVTIEPGSAVELTDAPKINRFKYTFVKPNTAAAFSFTDSQISTGEPIVISDEAGHYALANGYVTHVRRKRITVVVDRRLHNARIKSLDFDVERNQSFAGIMKVVDDANLPGTVVPEDSGEATVYRLDKDEFGNGMATVRNNLVRAMEHDLFGARSIRSLVIEGATPTFRNPTGQELTISASQANLNIDQRNAIKKVMSAKDYALVLGMPGTGKTTTIAHIIRALAAQGKSILLTSYTHTAVDNILLKIRDDGIGILRIGAIAKVHPEVQAFADLASVPKTNTEDLKRSYQNQVVATTCLGINHPIFNQRIFDYCIVDEASQTTLPVCLGPIRMARTFVLVGDHYQLPPLVQNKEAQEGGLDVSLFKLLSDAHPESVATLEHQYRMCEEIMSLSNALIYNGRLKCGTAAVATRTMHISNLAALKRHHHTTSSVAPWQTAFCQGPVSGTCWLRDVLDARNHVIFLNTDALLPAAREIARGSRITNPVEAAVTTQLVEALLTVGIAARDVGVITLYRSQLALLKQNLRSHAGAGTGGGNGGSSAGGGAVEMHTADKFQGRDKEVVVLSLVRSNEAKHVGDLLTDWRRVNVALTRARSKLLVVGSFSTMAAGSELLHKFCDMVQERGWRYDLKEGMLDAHAFEDWTTQYSAVPAGAEAGGKVKEAEPEQVESQKSAERKVGAPLKASQGRAGRKVVAEKKGRIDAEQILKRRPIMRDILSEVIG